MIDSEGSSWSQEPYQTDTLTADDMSRFMKPFLVINGVRNSDRQNLSRFKEEEILRMNALDLHVLDIREV